VSEQGPEAQEINQVIDDTIEDLLDRIDVIATKRGLGDRAVADILRQKDIDLEADWTAFVNDLDYERG
jgi:hypothetical protein